MAWTKHLFGFSVLAAGGLIALTFLAGLYLADGSQTSRRSAKTSMDTGNVHTSSPDPARQQSYLSIRTRPAGATVVIESDTIGSSPVERYSTPPGVLFVHLSKAGYRSLDTVVVASAGRHISEMFQLEPSQGSTEPEPSNASVNPQRATDNGAETTPDESSSTPTPPNSGSRSTSSQNTLSQDTSSENAARSATSTPAEGYIQISARPDQASIWLDGEYTGTAPGTLEVEPGRHTLSISKNDYESFHTTVAVRAGETHTINRTLQRMTGRLAVLVKPWGSIYIDGELHEEETDLQYTTSLPVGTHRIEATHPVLGSIERTVQITEGTTQQVTVNLNDRDRSSP